VHEHIAALYADLAAAYRRLAGEQGGGYYDQHDSPLGSRLHCRLVRCGALPGFRAGRRVLVRRSDLDIYLEHHRIAPTEAPPEATGDGNGNRNDKFETLLAEYGGR
jgi:hypothetical protein